mmetsp:Transcript_2186/g.5538  ORF Transcript_2186/g.5538 Transcript_2186/m.5538 type:complete len:251 (+) Transcript_2186:2585-3337(+)
MLACRRRSANTLGLLPALLPALSWMKLLMWGLHIGKLAAAGRRGSPAVPRFQACLGGAVDGLARGTVEDDLPFARVALPCFLLPLKEAPPSAAPPWVCPALALFPPVPSSTPTPSPLPPPLPSSLLALPLLLRMGFALEVWVRERGPFDPWVLPCLALLFFLALVAALGLGLASKTSTSGSAALSGLLEPCIAPAGAALLDLNKLAVAGRVGSSEARGEDADGEAGARAARLCHKDCAPSARERDRLPRR